MSVQLVNLKELLVPWVKGVDKEIPLTYMTLDSRKIKKGSLFIAIIGHETDGRKFISQAIQKGAAAVLEETLSEKEHGTLSYSDAIPHIYFYALNQYISAIANRFYHHPSRHFPIVGVTGTNGKTTITQLVAQWVNLLGGNAGVMGTTGNGLLKHLQSSLNTTGSAIDIIEHLHQLHEKKANLVAMEISSHGLVQHRVADLDFKIGIFTNLSRDHLDYHKTMYAYAQAKKSLFTQHRTEYAVLNMDDVIGQEIQKECSKAVGVALNKQNLAQMKGDTLWANKVTFDDQGICIDFDSTWGTGRLQAPLIGDFNASNLMLAFATMLILGYEKEALLNTAGQLTSVIGRMEVFTSSNASEKPMAIVDYAHTPDALEKALKALKNHCTGQLWCVFGCGGDRDKGKRPMMAKVATSCADHCIITNDNPRTEDANDIIADIVPGVVNGADYLIEPDRKKACELALNQAQVQDIVLIAGKGHEDYQIIGKDKRHYSDRETVASWMEKKA